MNDRGRYTDPEEHGGYHCIAVMRRTLAEDLDDIRDGAIARMHQWKSATADAQVPFSYSVEDGVADLWLDELHEQIANASDERLQVYFRERYPEGECGACGAVWGRD